jgi:thiol-disulfide isomerase/thioredoxin
MRRIHQQVRFIDGVSRVALGDICQRCRGARSAALHRETVDGKQFSGASLAGKPVVMWFWAPWCPICQGEAPGVAAAAHANPAVSFVGVAALDQLPAMQQFVSKYDLGFFPNIADVDGAVWQKFGVTAQPAYAFIAPDGSVDTVRGTLSESDLTARIRTLAASAS